MGVVVTRGRWALWSLRSDGRCGHYGAMGVVVTGGRQALWPLGGDGRCSH